MSGRGRVVASALILSALYSVGNTAAGGTWNNPTAIYTPRYARLNFTVSF